VRNGKEGMNVYAELSFPDAGEMLVKAELVVKIAEILHERGLEPGAGGKGVGVEPAEALEDAARTISRHQRDEDDGLPDPVGTRRQDCGGAGQESRRRPREGRVAA
jgi:hypothetical protein